MYNLAV